MKSGIGKDHLEKLVKYLNLFYFEINPFFLFLPCFSSYPPIHSSGTYSVYAVLDAQNAKINGISVPGKYTQWNIILRWALPWSKYFSIMNLISFKTHLYYWHSDNELKSINDSKNAYCHFYVVGKCQYVKLSIRSW